MEPECVLGREIGWERQILDNSYEILEKRK